MKELEDRVPEFAGAANQNVLPQTESGTEMDGMMEMISHFTRKQKRKVFKPSFSASVKASFRKKIE